MANIIEWKDEELPPVGAIVEWTKSSADVGYTSAHWERSDRLECIAHKESEYNSELVAVFWNIDNKTADSSVRFYEGKELYRKIKTDREKTIGAAVDILMENPLSNHNTMAGLSKLFEAGMLKLPD